MTTSLRLKNDKRLRDKLYTPENYQHPAKGHLGLWQAIIEKYTKPGDTILDPMSGVGATLTAALMGRNVMCNEMEHHFLLPMVRSWAKMMQHPFLGAIIGEVEILWGDARDFGTVQPWPWQRLFTYVWDAKVKSVNPGYCFKMAGFGYAGCNKDGGLSILERVP